MAGSFSSRASNVTVTEVRPITRDDLHEIAELHLITFPSSDLTRAGRKVVKRYYETQWERPGEERLFAGIREGGRLAAFICAGHLSDALSVFLRRHRWFLVGNYALRPWLLLDRDTAGRLRTAAGLRERPSVGSVSTPRYRVLSIATHPSFRGRGYAKRLLQVAEDEARRVGESEMGLTVEPDNTAAIGLYAALGWEPIQQGSTWSGSMRKILR